MKPLERTYLTVKDEDGFDLVIWRQSPLIWRVADPLTTLLITANLLPRKETNVLLPHNKTTAPHAERQ